MKTTLKLLTGVAAIGLLLQHAAPAFALGANNAKSHDSTLGAATTVMPKKEVEAAPAPAPTPAPAPVAETYTPVITPVEAPKPLAANDFAGPYVGAEGGYDFVGGMDGWKGGGFVGYGWTPHSDSALKPYLGIETGFDWSNVDGDGQAEKKIASISLRPGAVINQNVLTYGILGYNKADFKNNITGGKNWVNGYSLGLGTEVAPARSPLHLRLEYAYSIYDKSNLGGADIKAHDNDVKVGLLYRFK